MAQPTWTAITSCDSNCSREIDPNPNALNYILNGTASDLRITKLRDSPPGWSVPDLVMRAIQTVTNFRHHNNQPRPPPSHPPFNRRRRCRPWGLPKFPHTIQVPAHQVVTYFVSEKQVNWTQREEGRVRLRETNQRRTTGNCDSKLPQFVIRNRSGRGILSSLWPVSCSSQEAEIEYLFVLRVP